MSVASDMLSHHTQVLSFKRNWDVIAQSTVGRFSKGDPGGMRQLVFSIASGGLRLFCSQQAFLLEVLRSYASVYLGSGSQETGLKVNPGRETGQEDNTFAATAPFFLEYLLNELQ